MHDQAHLTTLPNEVWLLIAEHATPNTLRALCLVSRSFRTLTQPVLFRHFSQGDHDRPRSLAPFMSVCLARPDLAAAVRDATIIDIQEDAHLASHFPQIHAAHRGRWPGPAPSTADDDEHDITYHATLDTRHIALFLSLLPNLMHLQLDVPHYAPLALESTLEHARTQWTSRGPGFGPFLAHLRHLQLDWSLEEDGLDPTSLRPLLALPALATLQGHKVASKHDYDYEEGMEPGPLAAPGELALECVDLRCSILSDRHVAELVEGCRALRSLRVVYGDVTTGAVTEFDWGVVSRALRQPAPAASLEALTLDFEGETATEVLEDESVSGVLDMAGCERLRHVDVPAWALLRDGGGGGAASASAGASFVRLLPRSLERLVVRSCTASTVAELWDLLSSLDALPRLEEIAFRAKEGVDLGNLDGFKSACREKGIGVNRQGCVLAFAVPPPLPFLVGLLCC
jgi:hypothetical protein